MTVTVNVECYCKEVIHKFRNCTPEPSDDTKHAIDKCKYFNSDDIKSYELLILRHGGQDLEKFVNKYEKESPSSETRQKFEAFWMNVSKLLVALSELDKKRIFHRDMKLQNIVYNEKTGRLNIIDFGLMTNYSNFYKHNLKLHWSYPPEIELVKPPVFENIVKLPIEYMHEYALYIQTTLLCNHSAYYNTIYYKKTDGDFKKFLLTHRNEFTNYLIRQFRNIGRSTENKRIRISERAVQTFDSYGLGMALLTIIKRTYQHLGDQKELITNLIDMFSRMISWDLDYRIPPGIEQINAYKTILSNAGWLSKYNVSYDDKYYHIVSPTQENIVLSNNDLPLLNLKKDSLETINLSSIKNNNSNTRKVKKHRKTKKNKLSSQQVL